ncbi:MAG: tetratricopeptide repeat protein [Alphaproteobacteria bacterium]
MNAPRQSQPAVDDDADYQVALADAMASDGAAADAEAAYDAALALDPDHVQALIGRGRLALLQGDSTTAAALFMRAASLRPDVPGLSNAAAEAYKAGGDADRAAGAYEATLDATPGDADATQGLAHLMLSLNDFAGAAAVTARYLADNDDDSGAISYFGGVAAHRLGHPADACRLLRQAAETMQPPVPEVLQSWLLAHVDQEQWAQAESIAEQIIARYPDDNECWRIIGAARRLAGDLDGAEAALRHADDLMPGRPETLMQLVHVAGDRGDTAGQRELLLRIEATGHADAALLNDIGMTFQIEGRHAESLDWFTRAVELDPTCIHALNNIAAAYGYMGRAAEALAMLRQVAALAPEATWARANLANVLQNHGFHEEAIDVYRTLLQQAPSTASAWPCLLHSQLMLCDWQDLDRVYAKTEAAMTTLVAAENSEGMLAFGLLNSPVGMDLRREVAVALTTAAARKVAGASLAAPPTIARRGDRLRIGYMSADFREHSVATVFRPVLEAHDRAGFEWFAYSMVFGTDPIRRRFEASFDKFTDITTLGHAEAAQAIADDGLDVLVDMAGLQTGGRYEPLALKPAPVQAHWLGYGATVGGNYIDYLITDEACTPPDLRSYCAESLCMLPHSFMPVAPDLPDRGMPTRAEVGLPEDAFVLANFNEPYKLEPTVWNLWMRILRAHQDAVLWLVEGPPIAASHLRREARARGVDPDRLIFAERWPRPAHLARIPLADLALDSLFHVGGVTTADCLWRGLPVLCWAGPTPNARTGVSLLRACQADDLVADTLEDYVAMAGQFIRDRQRLERWRRHLSRRDLPAYDVTGLAGDLERGYHAMIARHRDGLPPADITLD